MMMMMIIVISIDDNHSHLIYDMIYISCSDAEPLPHIPVVEVSSDEEEVENVTQFTPK